MVICKLSSSPWIKLSVIACEKKNYGKKRPGGTNPAAPLWVLCLLSQGCRIKLSPIKKNERWEKWKVCREVKEWWKRSQKKRGFLDVIASFGLSAKMDFQMHNCTGSLMCFPVCYNVPWLTRMVLVGLGLLLPVRLDLVCSTSWRRTQPLSSWVNLSINTHWTFIFLAHNHTTCSRVKGKTEAKYQRPHSLL